MIIKGRVVSGSKDGASFIAKYRNKLIEVCGFEPFPGTLNIESGVPVQYPEKSKFISSSGGLNAVWCYPCMILNTEGFVIVREDSIYGPEIVEVISPFCLRTKKQLKNGDFVDVEVREGR